MTASARSLGRREPLLEVEQLSVRYVTPAGPVAVAKDVSFTISAGECLGVVGESGAGKSQAFLALLGLLGGQAQISGRARWQNTDLLTLTPAQRARLRGRELALIGQDALSSLTPYRRIGDQIAELLSVHRGLLRGDASARVEALLRAVEFDEPARRSAQYPHELSGGMRQRVLIAMALALEPKLLIADEPTTALDALVQARILELLRRLRRDHGTAIVLISHDLGVVASLAERVAVMRAGMIIETADTAEVLRNPRHAFTRELVATLPLHEARSLSVSPVSSADEPALRVERLQVRYPRHGAGPLNAVDEVDLHIARAEALGIIGESGSGKSTLVRAVLQLVRPSAGRVVWLGRELHRMSEEELRPIRTTLQVIFQNPFGSLDPRMTIEVIVAEPLRVHRPQLDAGARRAEVSRTLAHVGLADSMLDRYPHELSGGECQRVAIARAIILQPQLLICDEPVSSLDLTTQARITALLKSLMEEFGMSLLFVGHHLSAIRDLCQRVLVLFGGRVVEVGATHRLFARPLHPYTRALLSAVPSASHALAPEERPPLALQELGAPSPSALGCNYRLRCAHAVERCSTDRPVLEAVGDSQVACHRWREFTVSVQVLTRGQV